ncbi:hypothetical protein HQ535_08950 [bacterium]|nr:hypothetical protein [bacterium]
MTWSKERHDAARARCERATHGPWGWEQPGEKENGFAVGSFHPPAIGLVKPWYDETGENRPEPDDWPFPDEEVCEQWGGTVNYGDAAFIAHARTDLPDALDRIEALEAFITEATVGEPNDGTDNDEGITVCQSCWAVAYVRKPITHDAACPVATIMDWPRAKP